jgi:hypothetical protein
MTSIVLTALVMFLLGVAIGVLFDKWLLIVLTAIALAALGFGYYVFVVQSRYAFALANGLGFLYEVLLPTALFLAAMWTTAAIAHFARKRASR